MPCAYSVGQPVAPAAMAARMPKSAIFLYASGGISRAWSHSAANGERCSSVKRRMAERSLKCEAL